MGWRDNNWKVQFYWAIIDDVEREVAKNKDHLFRKMSEVLKTILV